MSVFESNGASPLTWRPWQSYLLVFVGSLCTLVLEIVAGRVAAPAVGASLYTWTGVIGVVLAGIAAGNFLGGLLAGRSGRAVTLAAVLLAASATAWMVTVVVSTVSLSAAFGWLPLVVRVVALVAALFFFSCTLLGMITPLVAQLTVRHVAEAGSVVGRLGAVGAAGSIAGTFLAGFVLIPTFGTRAILGSVSFVLLLLALVPAWRRVPLRSRRALITGVLVGIVAGGGTGLAYYQNQNGCLQETAYYCIRVGTMNEVDVEVKTLQLDRLLHSYTAPAEPRFLKYDYLRVFADLAAYVVQDQGRVVGPSSVQALFVGGGGYTLPRYLQKVYPGSDLDVLEIDAGVTQTARDHLGLELGNGITVYHSDARTGIERLPSRHYDLVFGDAFNDLSVPWHLTTREFKEQVRRVLRDDGLYAANVIDRLQSGRFLAAFVRTLREVFGYVTIVASSSLDWGVDRQNTWVVVASQRRLDADRLQGLTRPGVNGLEPARARMVDSSEVDAWLGSRSPPAIVLTDDFAPVDNYLAPLFLQR